VDYIVVRPCRRGGYELRDTLGKYMGCALILEQAYRVAAAEGDPVILELAPDTRRVDWPPALLSWLRVLSAWLWTPIPTFKGESGR